jgi:hypothetical protein
VLCGRCPGYWGKDSTRHGYYGEHINEWSPKLCSPSDTIYTQLCSPFSVVRASKTSWRWAGQESGSHTKRWVECVRRIGHRPRKTKETNCAHSSVSLLDIFTHTEEFSQKRIRNSSYKESIEKHRKRFRSGYQDPCVFEFIPKIFCRRHDVEKVVNKSLLWVCEETRNNTTKRKISERRRHISVPWKALLSPLAILLRASRN